MNYHLIDMQVHGDRRGKLISLEGLKNVPFEIKRIYYMFDTLPNEARGFHAHKELEQIIIAMDGAHRFILDDGEKRGQVLLNRPDVGLYKSKKYVSLNLKERIYLYLAHYKFLFWAFVKFRKKLL